MSTRYRSRKPPPDDSWQALSPVGRERFDAADQVAFVSRAKRDWLLRVHRHRLRREDLEDCLSQATLELVVSARAGAKFASALHLANVLEQRFLSRVADRRRALGGRSPMQAAMEHALVLGDPTQGEVDPVDSRPGIEELVMLRQRLDRLPKAAAQLSPEQRLVLASQVALQMGRAEFCARYGWSPEKYRKVAQRARARLRTFIEQEISDFDQRPVPAVAGVSERYVGTKL
jgi:DNA-directed RNA polymerase specialized sigma24 family protein